MLKLWVLLACVFEAYNAVKLFGWAQLIVRNESRRDFRVYWNVPTFMCHQYGMYFEEVSANFGILQNRKDQFRGDQLAILYDPGVFPALMKDANGNLIRRNGGVPQEGNLTYHLEFFRKHVVEQISDRSFRGLGVIDFESWRPIFRQNWASLAPYRDLSVKIERERHPYWNKKSVELEAVRRFEKFGRLFMEETLKAAKDLRPLASWGYYAYPYCFNLTPQQPNAHCDSKVLEENDRMSWLFDLENVLFPSIYLRLNLNESERMDLIDGRINEALRISKKMRSRPRVLPYFWYKYQGSTDDFLSRDDVNGGMRKISSVGANGVVIWGSSNDVNTKAKCQLLRDYVNNTLGPVIRDTKNVYEDVEIEMTTSSSTEKNVRDELQNAMETGVDVILENGNFVNILNSNDRFENVSQSENVARTKIDEYVKKLEPIVARNDF